MNSRTSVTLYGAVAIIHQEKKYIDKRNCEWFSRMDEVSSLDTDILIHVMYSYLIPVMKYVLEDCRNEPDFYIGSCPKGMGYIGDNFKSYTSDIMVWANLFLTELRYRNINDYDTDQLIEVFSVLFDHFRFRCALSYYIFEELAGNTPLSGMFMQFTCYNPDSSYKACKI
nr:MAG TPA: hypothetical protein [Caudoviricetes sp.]